MYGRASLISSMIASNCLHIFRWSIWKLFLLHSCTKSVLVFLSPVTNVARSWLRSNTLSR